MKRQVSLTLSLALVIAGMFLMPTDTGLAQEPEPGKKESASAWSDDKCIANSANFVIPPGWIGTEVYSQPNTSFSPCSGIGHTDRVGYTVTGPVEWTRGVKWSGGEYGTKPPEILPSGNYQISLEWHGKRDSYTLYYTLQPETCTPGERKSVEAWSDTDCNQHATLFTIPAGCVGTKVSASIDTLWLPCSGIGHPDRVGYTLIGPEGSWTRGITWERDEFGPALPTTLPAGNYRFEMAAAGKQDSCVLEYTLQKAPGGTLPVKPTILYPGGDDATLDDLDLIFCIDVTGSMEDDIDSVKVAAASIVDTIAKNDNYRVAIIAYRDWDDSMGLPMFEDYAFSTDKAAIIANINSLSVGGGDDTPEAVFEALMRGIDSKAVGGWRNNVNKQIILMGDAPPHNPSREGLTPAIVAKAAEDADPVVIQALVVGNEGLYDSEAVEAFRELAELTKGNFFEAADASKVPEMLEETIKVIQSPKAIKLSNTSILLIGAFCCLGMVFVVVVVFVAIFWGRKRRPARRAPYAGPPPPSPAPRPSPASPAHWQGETMIASPVVAAELAVEEGPDRGGRFSLGPNTRLGRAADNEIVLRDSQISRHHAVINFTGSEYVIADLGSANGTKVNGVRIDQPCPLRSGDVIAVGSNQLVFRTR